MRTQRSQTVFIRANRVRRQGSAYVPGEAVALAPRLIHGFGPSHPFWPNAEQPETAQYTRVDYAGERLELFLPFVDFLAALAEAGVKLVDARRESPKAEALNDTKTTQGVVT